MPSDFSHRVDSLAKRQGTSIRELARRMGISNSTMFLLRSGKQDPTLKTLRKLEAIESEASGIPRDRSAIADQSEMPVMRRIRYSGPSPCDRLTREIVKSASLLESESSLTIKAALAAHIASLGGELHRLAVQSIAAGSPEQTEPTP